MKKNINNIVQNNTKIKSSKSRKIENQCEPTQVVGNHIFKNEI